MIEIINDDNRISLNSDSYPIKLVKSFTVTTTTYYVGQTDADWCAADTGLIYEPTMLVFTRARNDNVYSGVGFSGSTSALPADYPVSRALFIVTTRPATVDVWICRTTYNEEAPAANYGVEIYNGASRRTFSTPTVSIPFEQVIIPQKVPAGNLRHGAMASAVSLCSLYTAYSNPFSFMWIQVQRIDTSSYSTGRLAIFFTPGGNMPALRGPTEWGDWNVVKQPQQPVMFIDKSRLPLPFG